MASDRIDVARLLEKLRISARLDRDEFLALCPFHDDTKPSWSIHRITGNHHCFACGAGGTAASLVLQVLDVERLGWSRGDAWDWIRKQGCVIGEAEVALDVELFLRMPERRRAFVLPASVRCDEPLTDWPTPARRYLASRNIEARQVRRWGIGYAIDGRLAGRIVFPVRRADGSPASYSARSFVGSPVRYLTPDESEHPDKGSLFGEQHWPTSNRRRVVVVEGAIKALAVERAVGGDVAGVLGATQAQNPHVVAKLSTFQEVVVLRDPDLAGEKAAVALYAALARHTRVRVLQVPGVAVDDALPGEIRMTIWQGALPGSARCFAKIVKLVGRPSFVCCGETRAT